MVPSHEDPKGRVSGGAGTSGVAPGRVRKEGGWEGNGELGVGWPAGPFWRVPRAALGLSLNDPEPCITSELSAWFQRLSWPLGIQRAAGRRLGGPTALPGFHGACAAVGPAVHVQRPPCPRDRAPERQAWGEGALHTVRLGLQVEGRA